MAKEAGRDKYLTRIDMNNEINMVYLQLTRKWLESKHEFYRFNINKWERVP